MRDIDLLKEVGHCHFELCHICERLVIFKREADKPPEEKNIKLMIKFNVSGFKNLVDSNIPVFRKTAATLLNASKTIKQCK